MSKIVIVGNGNFGVDAIKALLSDLFQTMRLDRNNDGSISRGEWFGAISGLVPSLFNIGEVTEEVKDLTNDEFKEVIRWAGEHFPDYTGVNNDVEDLVRQTLIVVSEMIKWVNKLAAVRRNRNELPGSVSPALEEVVVPSPVVSKVIPPAIQKARPGAKLEVEQPLDSDELGPEPEGPIVEM